VSKDV